MILQSSVYKERRLKLIEKMPPDSAVLIPSMPETIRCGDVHWTYRQNSDLIYFTGFEEPHSCLLLVSNRSTSTNTLFVQAKDEQKELWTGSIYGPEEAGRVFQFDQCYPVKDFLTKTIALLKNTKDIYYSFGVNRSWDEQMNKIIQQLQSKKNRQISFYKSNTLISPLRMKKSSEEVELLRKSADIAGQAHIEVMKHTATGKNERELHGLFLSEIMKRGASTEAYPGIFASGSNACVLHYIANNRVMEDGELFLVDAGAEYEYYASDITRTFPVSGRFSPLQKRIYSKLLSVQKRLIDELKPGISFCNIQDKTAELLSEVMIDEGFLKDSLSEVLQNGFYKKYFPHSFGHLLGLDVHDLTAKEAGDLKLEEGFVLTMEPGLYFPPSDTSLSDEVRGLGYRIEDDVLITAQGSEVLSHKTPKEVEELETLIGSAL